MVLYSTYYIVLHPYVDGLPPSEQRRYATETIPSLCRGIAGGDKETKPLVSIPSLRGRITGRK